MSSQSTDERVCGECGSVGNSSREEECPFCGDAFESEAAAAAAAAAAEPLCCSPGCNRCGRTDWTIYSSEGGLAWCVVCALAEIDRLRIEVSEWKHRAVGGTCRMLFKGDACDCSLCRRDEAIAKLANERDMLQHLLGGAQAMCDGMLTERDRLTEQVKTLRGGLQKICYTIEKNNEQNGFWGVASAHGHIRTTAIETLEAAK